jgi:hypothetical protein
MRFTEGLKEQKFERKKFLYAAGLVALGGFLLTKLPLKFLSSKAEKIAYRNNNTNIQVRENPDSVKRTNA